MLLKKTHNAKLVTQIKSVLDTDDGDLIIEGYANTVTKDRAGDVIPKEAWETKNAMTNYLKNPIILAYHNHSNAIGKMIDFEVTELGLKIKAKISKGAGDVYHLIKDGILSTFSVGFGILDAEYDHKSDTYYINDVELHEISVVAVPCNQDSVFSVAKSMESTDFELFKTNITPVETGDLKDEKIMNEEELKALLATMQANSVDAAADAATKAIAAVEAKKTADALAIANAEKALSAADAKVKSAAKAEAEVLVTALKGELATKDGVFAEMVKANNDQIVALKEEIAQVVASRGNPMTAIAAGVKGIPSTKEAEREVDALVMTSIIKKMDVFDTNIGQRVKAVNASSSIVVSSDGYETEFSTNLMRDIQAKLIIAPLFTELAMNSANMTIPINPARKNANWVSAANMADGSASARTGDEITVALTEKTLKTFKLAAKTYLTEETEEDAIISVIPLLRAHLVESHASEMDAAFLIGDGSAKPKGLVTQAKAASDQDHVAVANMTIKVTAADLLAARRKMGLYGIDLKDISLVVSQDAYWDLLEDAEWADVQQVGDASAVKLTGEVGNVYGMKVLVSDEFATKALTAAFAVMVNTSNFVVTRQRGMTLRSDFDIELDRTVFVATQRVNLESLIDDGTGNGKGVVSISYAAA
jgi:HK97 family phage prohead protease/HK97 family phage major capsid protein